MCFLCLLGWGYLLIHRVYHPSPRVPTAVITKIIVCLLMFISVLSPKYSKWNLPQILFHQESVFSLQANGIFGSVEASSRRTAVSRTTAPSTAPPGWRSLVLVRDLIRQAYSRYEFPLFWWPHESALNIINILHCQREMISFFMIIEFGTHKLMI